MNLEIKRHSLSHIMAAAVSNLWPDVKFAIGPAIENGFYYDFDDIKVSDQDLEKIEKEMRKIIKNNIKFEKYIIQVDEAIKKEEKRGQVYKKELIQELKEKGEKEVSYYRLGDFEDLCRGPHIESTGQIEDGSFKLDKLAGAYWRGSEKNKMLVRIYGLAFESRKGLEEYLEMLREAEARDHKKIGKEMDLFSMHEEGPGFPFFHPSGMVVWNQLLDYWKEEHKKENYQEIRTPIILNRKLWEKSGHWDHYKENMYFTKIDDKDYAVKPMNCPGGILVYKNRPHSYRELPIKMGEIGLVHRHELSGTLNGLFRVRAFNQDDAHIYCRKDQIKEEVIKVAKLIDRMYKTFGLKYHVELSTKPENHAGSDEMWKIAEEALEEALKDLKWEYKINPGDGAFYGPKIDFHIEDALKRTWQCGTLQLDFVMPEKFDLTYTGEDGKEQRVVMLHRTVFGAIERFLGVLIEHFAGKFPVWISPIQVKIISVGERHSDFCHKLKRELLEDSYFRIQVDDTNDTVSNKIRKSIQQKVPYVLVVGDREIQSDLLSVRYRGKKEAIEISKSDFIKEINEKIEKRLLDLI